MKKAALFLWIGSLAFSGWSQYSPVDQGSSVRFKIKNFGFSVTGSFSGLQGQVQFDPNNPSKDGFDVTLKASTINTGNNLRDNHLRENTYFDATTYPQIHFVSTRVSVSQTSGHFVVAGKLTIKKTTKDVSFPFSATPSGTGYLFSGEFNLNRRDFDVGGSSTISDSLQVMLSVLAKKN
jgi:polyisoprenoid-binding protein YceI